jgi:hypothetical protein
MDIRELEELLRQGKVRPDWYSLDGKLIPDRMIIRQQEDGWHVFYFGDRGEMTNESIFGSETEACKYLYNVLLDQHRKSNSPNS